MVKLCILARYSGYLFSKGCAVERENVFMKRKKVNINQCNQRYA